MAVAVRTLALLTALCAGLAGALPAWALGAGEPFVPPRRPAVAAAAPAPSAPSAASAASAAREAVLQADPGDAVATGGFSGVRLGQRPQALIDGQWVVIGQAVRGAQLSAVQADHALLRWADGRTERLALAGQIELVRRGNAAPRSNPRAEMP